MYTENMQTESMCILIIHRMNLSVYGEYAEWICLYTENTQNDLFAYWRIPGTICISTKNKRTEKKVQYLGKFETKIEIILGCLSGAKTKKSQASVPESRLRTTKWLLDILPCLRCWSPLSPQPPGALKRSVLHIEQLYLILPDSLFTILAPLQVVVTHFGKDLVATVEIYFQHWLQD